MAEKTAHSWVLQERPTGMIDKNTLAWRERTLPDLGEGQFQVRTDYLSLDATNRIWMSDMESYLPPSPLDEPMRGVVLGTVEESRNPDFPEGTRVTGLASWSDRFVNTEAMVQPFPIPGEIDPAQAFALTGGGATAWIGLKEVGGLQAGETVVVDAAAGSVGTMVGQIARLSGARVIGIAGGADKCAMLTEDLGFAAAIDHRNDDVAARLKELAPGGIDLAFENVGGPIFDAVLGNMKQFGRVVVCGLIASYNATEPVPGPYRFAEIVMRRLTMRGFIVFDHLDVMPQAIGELVGWLADGTLQVPVHVVDGLENAPETLNLLYTGGNTGKLMIRI